MVTKLGIVATHPIQYHTPLFRQLAQRADLKPVVYYGLLPTADQQGVGFGQSFIWDVPLLEGYDWKVMTNTARQPNLDTFTGVATPDVSRQLSDDQLDIVLVTGWQAMSLVQAVWACRQLGLPCLMRGESNGFRKRSVRVRLIHRLLFRYIDAYLVIGNRNRDFYRQYNIAEAAMFHCPYFVDNDFFASRIASVAPQRKDIRRAWGIAENRAVFLFCGKLVEKKHPLDVLQAAALAVRDRACLHVVVAGDGELRETCETFAQAHQLPVTFVGFLNQTELPKAYAAADCLVLPSDVGETWGLVVNEAMACGLPAIVSNEVGCGPDLILPDRTGWTFPRGDIDALSRLMTKAAAQPEVLRPMGLQAQAHIAKFSVEAATDGIMKAVQAFTT